MASLGWDQPDFVLVSGDAYVDHPSFGAAVISRVLEAEGFRVAILAQPDYKSCDDFRRFGKPRLGFLITSGNMDSMVNHYTSTKKPRSEDAYTPGGTTGKRPDRAAIVYSTRAREAYPKVPIILGGIEASLRRLSHYDYWSDKVRRPIIVDGKADLVVYGMGEYAIREVARRLAAGESITSINDVRGTVVRMDHLPADKGIITLPSWDLVQSDKSVYAKHFMLQYRNTDPHSAKSLAEEHFGDWIIQNPPAFPLEQEKLDAVYELPYMRLPHPVYDNQGHIPAIDEVQFSLTATRGCFGGCSFCALTFHQGRLVRARSHASLVSEAELLVRQPGFKGYIHDVGGPTANFRVPACAKQAEHGACVDKQCLAPEMCKQIKPDHSEFRELLSKLRKVQGVKKVFIRSGIRFDYLMADPDEGFFRDLVNNHISGQLKVAPEHIDNRVLAAMGKPKHEVYERFAERYKALNIEAGKTQYLVPYFISGHPGSDLAAAIRMAEYLRDEHIQPQQVQDFYPTPGTLSTCMYHTGIDPRTGKPIYVPREAGEKGMQRALLQFRKEENRKLVIKALESAGRSELIGFDPNCLVSPGGRPKVSRGPKPGTAPAAKKPASTEPGRPGRKPVGRKQAIHKKPLNYRDVKPRPAPDHTQEHEPSRHDRSAKNPYESGEFGPPSRKPRPKAGWPSARASGANNNTEPKAQAAQSNRSENKSDKPGSSQTAHGGKASKQRKGKQSPRIR